MSLPTGWWVRGLGEQGQSEPCSLAAGLQGWGWTHGDSDRMVLMQTLVGRQETAASVCEQGEGNKHTTHTPYTDTSYTPDTPHTHIHCAQNTTHTPYTAHTIHTQTHTRHIPQIFYAYHTHTDIHHTHTMHITHHTHTHTPYKIGRAHV